MNQDKVLQQTACWVEKFVVKHDICPFAHKVVQEQSIHYALIDEKELEEVLESFVQECIRLMQRKDIETSLLIYTQIFEEFSDYLDGLRMAELLLEEFGFSGTFQIASFHPNYLFEGSTEEDAANYTNRSPFPMMHLIREDSLENAVGHYPNPERIPIRNVEYTRALGIEKIQAIIKSCI